MLALAWMTLFACSHPVPVASIGEPTPEVAEDLRYGSQPTDVLDLYTVPDGVERPVVVFVHGGSWVGGDKDHLDEAPGLVDWFLDRGFAVAAPEFRHASRPPEDDVGLGDMLTDVASAIGWLQEHHTEHGLQERSMVLVGFSSGAHLVSLLSTDPSWLADAGVSKADLAAVVALDVHAYDVPLALELMEGSEVARNQPLIRHLFGTSLAQQQALSPSSYVDLPDIPPTLLVSAGPANTAEKKGYVAREASRIHRDRLEASGHSATHVHLERASHSSLVLGFGRSGHPPTDAVAELLSSALDGVGELGEPQP